MNTSENSGDTAETTGNISARPRRAAAHIGLIGAWALAFGCALGWDAFVMPWTTFLPKAGPLGTVIGIAVCSLVMAAIAWNYSYMSCRHPGPGGAYSYAKAAFGIDHGFLCAWFLMIAYIAITWMDASVLAYFFQHTWGVDFKIGLHYSIAGRDVTIVHILLSVLAIAYAATVCTRRRFAVQMQTVLAVVFAVGIAACFCVALSRHGGGLQSMAPAFARDAGGRLSQVLGIVAISPWLFIGFESISHSSGEFKFPRRKTFGVLAVSIATVALAYVFLTLIPALVPNITYHGAAGSWPEAVANLAKPGVDLNDTAFGTISLTFGRHGLFVISAIFISAIFTNLIGNTIAASRLLAAMADDGAMPAWLGARNSEGAPRNAIAAIAIVSVLVFALGESIIEIVVDLALIGGAIAYAYTSAATFKIAYMAKNRLSAASGLAGLILSTLLFGMFILPAFSENAATMSTASYLILVVWCVAGLIMFLSVFRRDCNDRFGHSPIVWLALTAVIVFLSVLWIRQATIETSAHAFSEITHFHDGICPSAELADALREEIRDRQGRMTQKFLDYSFVQTGLTVFALLLMLYLSIVLRRHEHRREMEKARAKSLFFSAVSHDMRTPLNAILGFSEMLKGGLRGEEERTQAIDSILVSGKTLLSLINDVLDLSKLEAGKMEVLPAPTDFPRLARDILDTFRTAGAKPGVEMRLDVGEMPPLMLDPQRIRQIIFNLVGNAVKFTDSGHITLRASFAPGGDGAGVFRLEVEDTGVGISEEDLARISSEYVQVGDRRARQGGTGLGLAICRQLAKAMGGELNVVSALDKGSTFSVTLQRVEAVSGRKPGEKEGRRGPASLPRRILAVDDSNMNLTVLKGLLGKIGEFDITTAASGEEALAALKVPGAKPFDLVLTDRWMPHLDGEGLVKAMRADPALSGMTVVVVTADVELRRHYASMGFDGILLKPITTATLTALFTNIADKRGKR